MPFKPRNLAPEFANTVAPQTPANRQITEEQQQRVNWKLARWIAQHFRPIQIVEDAGYVEFVRYITEGFGNVIAKVPKRTKMLEEICDLARHLRSQVK